MSERKLVVDRAYTRDRGLSSWPPVVYALAQLKMTLVTSMATETGSRTGEPSGLRT